MKTNNCKKPSKRAGFSMIEVLVASSILVVIVMMLGMLFQQSSLAWRTGIVRAEGFMRLRAAIGAIQRDASTAIDERTVVNGKVIATNLVSMFTDEFKAQTFEGDEIRFYTLTGTDDPLTRQFDHNRALTFVSIDTLGNRKQSVLGTDGQWSTPTESQIMNLSSGDSASEVAVEITGFEYPQPYDKNNLPAYVIVNANITTVGNLYEIGVASPGPDGEFGDPSDPNDRRNDDDIKTWVDK